MKQKGNDYIKEWINAPANKIDFSLVDELINYAEDRSFRAKVQRVYHKCIRQRHMELADKIQAKYSNYLPKSDLAMAFGYALMALKVKDDEIKNISYE